MTDQDFLEALYSGLLERPADAAGLADHLSWLEQQQGDPKRYSRLIADFVTGTEYERRSQWRRMLAGGNPLLPDMNAVRFTQAVSVGSFCHSAMALKQAGLRHHASPFDWLFSNPRAAAHAIEDDFKVFLDRSHYKPVPLEERSEPTVNLCEHNFYRERFGVQRMFNHHLPTQDGVHAYFQRAVQRFRQQLHSSQWTLFVLTLARPVGPAEIKPLLSALRAASTNFVLVELLFKVATPASQADVMPVRAQRAQADWLRVELDVTAPSHGTSFPGAADNRLLNTFLRSFQVNPAPQRDV